MAETGPREVRKTDLPAHPYLTVLLLAMCSALAMTGLVMLALVATLAGELLAPQKSLATLPVGLMFVGTMVTTVPASLLMKRIGRRNGFMVGAMFGLIAAILGIAALLAESFVTLVAAGFVQGMYSAFMLYYRFAAADAVPESHKSRAISYVMVGGVMAAVMGPELAKVSAGLFDDTLFLGSYIALAGLAIAAIVLIRFIDIPPPGEEERSGGGRPLREIVKLPTFLIAAMAAMVGYGSMALVMTATPLAMKFHAHSFADSAFVIQWHVMGMFVPSFFTGHLIRYFGSVRIILAGTTMMFAVVAVSATGTGLWEFWVALLFLGVGWNFMFVGGTTLITEIYTPREKAKVQGMNDFLVFGTNTVASLSAGMVLHLYGWQAVNYAVVLPLCVVFATAFLLRLKRRAAQRAAAIKAP